MWWHLFLEKWNGLSIVENPAESAPDITLYSDGSGSFGCGAWLRNQWLQIQWPHCVAADWSIAAKELVPIVLVALNIWGNQWDSKIGSGLL